MGGKEEGDRLDEIARSNPDFKERIDLIREAQKQNLKRNEEIRRVGQSIDETTRNLTQRNQEMFELSQRMIRGGPPGIGRFRWLKRLFGKGR